MRRPTAAALAILALVAAGCAGRPWIDNAALRQQTESEQTALLKRVVLYDDPALVDYLNRLAVRLTRPLGIPVLADAQAVAVHHDFTVYVVHDPTLALFAMPGGTVFVHTGLLAAVENEAQLAAALGHELAHASEQEGFEAGQPSRVAPRLDGAPVASPTAATIFAQGLPVAHRAAIRGYGRRRERAADGAAFGGMLQTGLDVRELPAAFQRLAEWSQEAGSREVFLFGDRQWLAAREDSARSMVDRLLERTGQAYGGRRTSQEFERVLRPVVRDNAYLDLRQGRFTLARRQLARVAALTPDDARVHLYDGELHRLEAQRAGSAAEREVELVQARAAYERALLLDPALGEAHRELGLLYYAMRDVARARGELEQYLAVAPAAPDRARVSEYVQELAR